MAKILVIDNGAWEIKAGLALGKEPAVVMPNCLVKSTKGGVKRLYVGDQTSSIREAATVYRRGFDRGYLADWGLERKVWDRLFSGDVLAVEPTALDLVCTVPPLQPARLLEDLAQVVFEEYRFAALFAPTSTSMMPWDPKVCVPSQGCSKGCIVVDAGYSHCHVMPCYDGYPVTYAAGRLDVGGKALTNYLKELISYRQWNMMDETWLVNHVKERLAYVSLEFEQDMRNMARAGQSHPILREFVLPDYITSRTGWIKGEDTPPAELADGTPRPPEQVLRMGSERIAVAECLFRPSDMGLPQMGLAEGLLHCVGQLPTELRPLICSKVIVGGGCANMPGLAARLASDVRAALPEDFAIRVECPERPNSCAWRGAAHYARDVHYPQFRVSGPDYAEYGAAICASTFALFG
jgi:actin-related protein 6